MNADDRSTRSRLAKVGHVWLPKNRWFSRGKTVARNHDFSFAYSSSLISRSLVLDALCYRQNRLERKGRLRVIAADVATLQIHHTRCNYFVAAISTTAL